MQKALLNSLILFCLLTFSVGGTVELSTLTEAQGLSLQSAAMGANLGSSIASCDFNGDSIKDVIIGAPNAYSGAGAVIIIYSGSDFSTVDLSDPAASGSGIILTATGQTGFGTKVGCLENADYNFATEELIIGEGTQAKFWIVFGQGGMASNEDISSLLKCEISDSASGSLRDAVGVGDVTGDGFGDAVVTVFDGSVYRGVLIMDFSSPSVDVSTPSVSHVVSITNGLQSIPMTFAPAGNFNGDSYKDLLVGNVQGTGIYAAAVIYGTDGSGSPYPVNIDLTSLDLTTTPQVLSITTDLTYPIGVSVAGAGDVDGDGLDEILLGNPGYNSGDGAVFVIYGSSTRNTPVDVYNFPTTGPDGYIVLHDQLTGLSFGAAVFGGLKSASDPTFASCDASTNCYFIFGEDNVELDTMTSDEGFKIYNSGSSASNPMQIFLIGDVNSDGFADYLIGQGAISSVFILYGANKCTTSGVCQTCTGPTSCTSCDSGGATPLFYEADCYAIGDCPSHSYQDSSTSCATCHTDCLDCTDSTANDCSSCDSGGSLPLFYTDTCYAVGSCPSHTYQDSSTTCAICHSTCLGCTTSGSNACSSCDSGGSTPLYYSNACYATGSCPSHTYQDSSTTCSTCHSTCLECTTSGPNACSSCDSGGSFPLHYFNACYAAGSCPSQSYQDSATTCATCDGTCLECSGSDTYCTSCNSGGLIPLLYNHGCYGSCPPGTFEDSATSCANCDVNCLECSGTATYCTSCDTGGSLPLLYNNECVASCPSHSYQDSSTTCASCNSRCLECSPTANNCDSCDNAGSYPLFYNSFCYGTGACPSHAYQDSVTTCAICDGNCLNCAGSATTCTSCNTSGSLPLFYNSACYSSCPSAAPYSYSYACVVECPSGTAADSNKACIAITPEVPQAVKALSSTDETRQISNEIMSTISSLTLGGVHSIRSQSVQGPVSYFIFLNVDYPNNYGQFAKSNFGSSRLPNPFRSTGRATGGRAGPINASLRNQSLLANIGYSIIFLIVCVLLIPLNDGALAALEVHKKDCHGKWYHRLLKRSSVSLRWSFLINQFVSKYQDLAFFSFLGIYNAGGEDDQDTLNLVVCIFGFLITVFGLFGAFFLIKNLTKKLKSFSEQEKEKKEYKNNDFLGRRVVLYKDLKKDEFMTMLYPFFLMLRVFGFCFVAIFLCNQTAIQLVFLNLYAVFMLFYLLKYQPLEERGQLWMTLAYEIDGFVALFGVTILAIYNKAGGTNENTKMGFGYMIIIANTVMLVLNFISFGFEMYEYAGLLFEKLKALSHKLKNKINGKIESNIQSISPQEGIDERVKMLSQKVTQPMSPPSVGPKEKKSIPEKLKAMSQKWKNVKKIAPEPVSTSSDLPKWKEPEPQQLVINTPSSFPEKPGLVNGESPGWMSPSNMSEVGFLDDKTSFAQMNNSMGLRERSSPKKRFTRTSIKIPVEDDIPESHV